MAALRGDPSDGLPGVRGVGEKTAAAMIRRYGSLAGLLAALEPATRVSPRPRRPGCATPPTTSRSHRAWSGWCVTCRSARWTTRCRAPRADPDALVALAERWGIASAVARLTDVLAG